MTSMVNLGKNATFQNLLDKLNVQIVMLEIQSFLTLVLKRDSNYNDSKVRIF